MTAGRQVMPDDHSELEPPLPIPNRTVKRYRADDSAETSVKVGYRQAIILKAPENQGLFYFFLDPLSLHSSPSTPSHPLVQTLHPSLRFQFRFSSDCLCTTVQIFETDTGRFLESDYNDIATVNFR